MSKAAALRAEIVKVLAEHERAGALPTSARFLYYELVVAAIISKVKTGARRTDQNMIDALTVLRESGEIPWEWIVDETRQLEDFSGAATIRDRVLDSLRYARLNPWRERIPLILTESRSLAGVLRALIAEYAVRIASTNGQTAGFLHNEIAPMLRAGDDVLYLGDWDFAGGQIEANTRSVLERVVGPLQWERLALTEEQVGRYDLMIIRKIDRRHKDGRELPSVETEALSQTIIVDIVRNRLRELLPESLKSVRARRNRRFTGRSSNDRSRTPRSKPPSLGTLAPGAWDHAATARAKAVAGALGVGAPKPATRPR
jgi:hypothetical protein